MTFMSKENWEAQKALNKMTKKEELIEKAKVMFPQTKAGNEMLKDIIRFARNQGKQEALVEVEKIIDECKKYSYQVKGCKRNLYIMEIEIKQKLKELKAK